jgi:hypothetical protein
MDTKCDCLPRFVKVENSSRKDEGFSEAIAWKSRQKFFGFCFSLVYGAFWWSWVEDIWGEGLWSLMVKLHIFDWSPFYWEGQFLMARLVLMKLRHLGAIFVST